MEALEMPVRDGYLTEEELATFARESDATGKCASCRFWEPHEEPTWREERFQLFMFQINADPPLHALVDYDGSCHRHAPAVMAFQAAPEDCPNDTRGWWPDTSWDGWCGDHVRARDGMPFEAE